MPSTGSFSCFAWTSILWSGGVGSVLDVQASQLSSLTTCSVVPLLHETEAPPRIRDLNPVFDVDGILHVMLTQAIATVPLKELGQAVASWDDHHDDVTRAIDMLFSGH